LNVNTTPQVAIESKKQSWCWYIMVSNSVSIFPQQAFFFIEKKITKKLSYYLSKTLQQYSFFMSTDIFFHFWIYSDIIDNKLHFFFLYKNKICCVGFIRVDFIHLEQLHRFGNYWWDKLVYGKRSGKFNANCGHLQSFWMKYKRTIKVE
jgi:hypothetical protein